MLKLRTRSAGVVAGVAVLAGIGVAFAAWTSTGTGQGTAQAGTAGTLTVSVETKAGLYPTGSVQVPFTVTNTNPYAIKLTTAHPQNFTVDAQHSGCTVTGGVITGDDVALSDTLAPSATSASHQVTIKMSNDAVDACQGATFGFDLVVTGASAAS